MWWWLLAQVQGAAEDALPWITLANLGLAGLILGLFLLGKLHSDKDYQQVLARAERAEAKLDELNDFIRREFSPTIARVLDALSRLAERRTRQ